MLTPSNRTITIASGGTALVGRTTAIPAPGGGGSSNPAWLVAHDAAVGLNAWRPIANTGAVGGSDVIEFSGFAEENGMLFSWGAGGHKLYDNRGVIGDFNQDVPGFVLVSAPTPVNQLVIDGDYNLDGKLGACHNRCDLWWSELYDRFIRIGARDLYAGPTNAPGSKPAVSSFNINNNTQDPAGTFPDVLGGSGVIIGGSFIGVDGSLNTYSGQRTMTGTTTKTWVANTNVISPGIRAPWATALELGLTFGLAVGSGWGDGGPYRAIKHVNIPGTGVVQTAITINPSAALTSFEAANPNEASMHWDAPNNRFVFHSGTAMWAVIPNGTNTWDMVDFTYGAGSASPTGTAISNRFIYSRRFKGFFFKPNINADIQFMRTSN